MNILSKSVENLLIFFDKNLYGKSNFRSFEVKPIFAISPPSPKVYMYPQNTTTVFYKNLPISGRERFGVFPTPDANELNIN